MQTLNRQCPFCGSEVVITETTEDQARRVGLVYLLAKCVPCDARIEAAGVGERDALEQMERMFAKRIGTTPTDWLIVPAVRGRRR